MYWLSCEPLQIVLSYAVGMGAGLAVVADDQMMGGSLFYPPQIALETGGAGALSQGFFGALCADGDGGVRRRFSRRRAVAERRDVKSASGILSYIIDDFDPNGR
jgi:hypothetical protein